MRHGVLVVDDSLTVRMDLTEVLESAGFRVIGCESVADARSALAVETLGLVILDVVLPDGDGVDLLREMRLASATARLPVMLLSSEAEVRDRVRGLLTGADEYAGKPYDRAYIVSRARELLRRLEPASEERRQTILVIDDSLSYREALSAALVAESYRVLTAISGEDGLRILADRRPDAVIVDGMLPGIDGATVVRRLRLDAATRGTPCLLLTASEDRSEEVRALDAGADAFVRKTEDLAVVLARLNAILRAAGSQTRDRGTSSLLGPKTILAVDDSATFREELAAALRSNGYEVVLARSGEEAIELLAVQSVDCILLDLIMPGIGGQETCRRVKAVPHLREIPLILLTSLEDRGALIDGLAAGADDFIAKSSDFDVLRARVLAQIRRAQFEDESRSYREQLLRLELEAEQRYRRILETTQEGVWTFDAQGRTTYANRRMGEMLGIDPDSMGGSRLHDFLDPGDVGLVFQHPSHATTERRELLAKRHDRSTFWASVSSTPIIDDGRYLGGLAMVSDITEQRKLQTQLMVADRMVSVGTLAAGVAHEINNPLTAVLSNLELAIKQIEQRRGADAAPWIAEVSDELRDAQDGGKRVQRIVRDLKVFSRGETDKRGPVDLVAVLESALRMTANELRHRAKLVKEFLPIPPVDGDESRFGQVFLNLLVNAAQAIPEGKADSNEVRVRTRQEGDRVVVEVEDTGEGMTADVVARLFTPFFTTKPVGVGTGLGLSICHRIVTAVGGELSVESERGRGTTFRVRLVAASVAVAPPVTAAPVVRSAPGRRGRVLVVDDEPAIGAVLRRHLESEHDVTVTTAAQEALDRVKRGEAFDVVICDLMMPHMTGMDLYGEIARIAPEQAARMVFLTGGAFTPRAQDFLLDGTKVHLEKPVDSAALRRVVAERVL